MKLLFLNLGFGELLLIALIYLLFFGSKNLPTLTRDVGRFIYKVKRSINEIYDELQSNENK